jgi:hypothetical protein
MGEKLSSWRVLEIISIIKIKFAHLTSARAPFAGCPHVDPHFFKDPAKANV